VRVAALYDIHANPVALRAVRAEVERERVDLIVAWAVLGPDVRLRCTDYDIRAAGAELRAGGWPGVDDFLRNSLLEPADPLVVAEALDRQAEGL